MKSMNDEGRVHWTRPSIVPIESLLCVLSAGCGYRRRYAHPDVFPQLLHL